MRVQKEKRKKKLANYDAVKLDLKFFIGQVISSSMILCYLILQNLTGTYCEIGGTCI